MKKAFHTAVALLALGTFGCAEQPGKKKEESKDGKDAKAAQTTKDAKDAKVAEEAKPAGDAKAAAVPPPMAPAQ